MNSKIVSLIIAGSALVACTPHHAPPESVVVYDPSTHSVPHTHRAHYGADVPPVKHVQSNYNNDIYLNDEYAVQDTVQRSHTGRAWANDVHSNTANPNHKPVNGYYLGQYPAYYNTSLGQHFYYDSNCTVVYAEHAPTVAVSSYMPGGYVNRHCSPYAYEPYRTHNNHRYYNTPYAYAYPQRYPEHEHTAIVSKGSPYRDIGGGQAVGDEMNGPLGLARYVRAISERLVSSSHFVNEQTPLGVASFVPLNKLNDSNLFGLQFAESLSYELQQYGFSIIEYKATDFIKVKDNGDFVYSRNVNELIQSTPIEYLVIGTYSESDRGLLVNARIVGAQSKVIVASAQQFVPISVYENSFGPRRIDGVRILSQPKSTRTQYMHDGERG